MSVVVKVIIFDKTDRVPCVSRATHLEFTDAPGQPLSVTDDVDNTYHRTTGKPDVWYTRAVHMPRLVTLNYNGSTDGFVVPRDLPRLGPTKR